jgi:putative addiction module component (TIGR02574 family)
MRPNEIATEIDKLDLTEKLILVEDIWDDIARNSGELPMPEWQKTELDRNISKEIEAIKRNSNKF